MSYNIHLKIVPISELDEIRNCKTYDEVFKKYEKDNAGYVGVYDLFEGYSDFCFGSDEDWVVQVEKDFGSDVFSSKSIKDYFEGDFFELSIEGFAKIIEFYKKEVGELYKGKLDMANYLLENPDKSGAEAYAEKLESIMKFFYFKAQDWGMGGLDTQPYNKRRDSEGLLNSNSYEYMIFELVRLYKKVDLTTETVVVYGY